MYALFLFYIISSHALELRISDIEYDVPTCGIAFENHLGTLTIKHSLLPEYVSFDIHLNQTTRSCRLCHISPSYCNTTIAPYLARDAGYNLKVVTVKNHESPVAVSYKLRNTTTTTKLYMEPLCGTHQRWIIMSIVTIDMPIQRDFVTIASDSSSRLIPCNRDTSITDLSCSLTPYYFQVQYSITNCLTENTSVNEYEGSQTSYTPLYYFYEHDLIPEDYTLCGETWLSIYERSRLDLWCDFDLPLYIKTKTWYFAALLTTAAYMNGRRDPTVWLALETLERTCASRESDIPLEETVFRDMAEALFVDFPTYDTETICRWIGHVDSNDIIRPVYLEYYREWYFTLYQYIVLDDADFPWKAKLLFATPFLILGAIIVGAIITTMHIYCRKRNEYKRIQ